MVSYFTVGLKGPLEQSLLRTAYLLLNCKCPMLGLLWLETLEKVKGQGVSV